MDFWRISRAIRRDRLDPINLEAPRKEENFGSCKVIEIDLIPRMGIIAMVQIYVAAFANKELSISNDWKHKSQLA